ncbi:MAG: VCBS repeat-containing protein [Planctomycetales bacterium]|nr:VCBS repeat-containing protein [Planctomycetales bacterium]
MSLTPQASATTHAAAATTALSTVPRLELNAQHALNLPGNTSELFRLTTAEAGRLTLTTTGPELRLLRSDGSLVLSGARSDTGSTLTLFLPQITEDLPYFVELTNGAAEFASLTLGSEWSPGTAPIDSLPLRDAFLTSASTTAQLNDDNADGVVDELDFIDLIAVDRVGSVFVLPGLGQGAFRPGFDVGFQSALPFGQRVDVSAIDVNADGRDEVVVLTQAVQIQSTTATVLQIDVEQQLATRLGSHITAGAVGEALELVDVNADGNVDLLTIDSSINQLSIHTGDGTGQFTLARQLPTGSAPARIRTADVENDGRVDLLVVNRGDDTVTLLHQGSQLTFNSQTLPLSTVGLGSGPLGPTDLDVRQLNDDNEDGLVNDADYLDIVVANHEANSVSVLLGSHGGAFGSATAVQLIDTAPTQSSGPAYTRLQLSQLNDDNSDGVIDAGDQLDLIVARSTERTVTVAHGNGNGTFSFAQAVGATGAVQSILMSDLDNDGRSDLAAFSFAGHSQVDLRFGRGDGTLTSPVQNLTGDNPLAIAIGDVNHDGWTDFMTANTATHDLSVFLGQGDGTFRTADRVPTGNSPTDLAIADFNQDGRLDVASLSRDDNIVAIHLGRGDGTFREAISITTEQSPVSLAAVQLNDDDGDGTISDRDWVDLAIGHAVSPELLVLYGTGDAQILTKSPASILPQPGHATRFVNTVDADSDGDLDLLVGTQPTENEPAAIVLITNDHGTSLSAATLQSVADELAIAPQSLDLNGDAILDFVYANGSKPTDLNVQLGTVSGDRQPAPPIPIGAAEISAFRFVQLDDDNRDGQIDTDDWIDLIVADADAHQVRVWRGQSTPLSFAADSIIVTRDEPTELTLLDANQDGHIDLLVTLGAAQEVDTFLGTASGSFTKITFPPSAGEVNPIVADLDGDHALDITSLADNGSVFVRWGRSEIAGVFEPAQRVEFDQPVSQLQVVSTPNGVMLAALARDGQSIELRHATATRDFQSPGRVNLDTPGMRLHAADLDRDGIDELLVLDDVGRLVTHSITSEGTYAAQPRLTATLPFTGPGRLDVADLNGDDLPDIAVAGQESSTVALFVQHAGTLKLSGVFAATSGPNVLSTAGRHNAIQSRTDIADLKLGDLDGDGNQDIVTVHRLTNRLSVLFGNGDVGFTDAVELEASGDPFALAISDVDDDSFLDDITILNGDGSAIDVYFGQLNGAPMSTVSETAPFRRSERTYPVGNVPSGLVSQQLSGSPHPDVMIGNSYGDLLVLENVWGGGVELFQPYARTDRHVALAVGDVNGDGVPDWVVANETNDRISLQYGELSATDGVTLQPASIQFPIGDRNERVAAPSAAVIGQLNDDNADGRIDVSDWPDLIVANSGANNILVYQGTGEEATPFASPDAYAAGTNPTDIQLEDLNLDNQPDLVITNQGSNDVSVLLGSPSGQLTPGVRLDVTPSPEAVSVVWYNEDLFPDLLVTSPTSGTTQLIPGRAGGTFNEADSRFYTPGIGSEPIMAGILPGIGVFTVNRGTNTVTQFDGFTSSAPVRRVTSTGGVRPVDALLRDFDGDGFTDLIIAHGESGGLSVLRSDGLLFADASTFLFADDLQHPTDLSLAEFASGSDFSILVADEGDDSVSVFNRLSANTRSRPFPLEAYFGLFNLKDLVPHLVSLIANTVLVQLPETVREPVTAHHAEERSGGGDRPPSRFQAVRHALEILAEKGESVWDFALNQIRDIPGLDILSTEVTDSAEEILETLLPGAPWDLLPPLRDFIRHAGRIHNYLQASQVQTPQAAPPSPEDSPAQNTAQVNLNSEPDLDTSNSAQIRITTRTFILDHLWTTLFGGLDEWILETVPFPETSAVTDYSSAAQPVTSAADADRRLANPE